MAQPYPPGIGFTQEQLINLRIQILAFCEIKKLAPRDAPVVRHSLARHSASVHCSKTLLVDLARQWPLHLLQTCSAY